MHVQPQRALRALVLRDVPQALAGPVRRQVQIRPVLHQQHGPLPLHPLPGPLAVRAEDRLRRDRLRVRMLDETVIACHQRLLAARHGVQRARRDLRQQLHRNHQALHQAGVAERRRAELLPGPGIAGQALPRLQRGHPHSQPSPPVRVQRPQVHRLGRHRAPVAGAAGRAAHLHPAGRPVAGPAVLGPDIALGQHGRETVDALEVGRDAAQAQALGLRRQMAAAHRRPDQEARHADHQVAAGIALLRRPADPLVARPLAARRGGKQEAAEQAGPGGDQIAHLAAGGADGAERMLPGQQRLEQAAVGPGLRRRHGQACQAVDPGGHGRGGRHVHGRGGRCLRLGARTGRGQADEAGLVEGDESGQAAAAARLAAGVEEVESLADGEGGGPAGGRGIGGEQAAQALQVGFPQQCGANRHWRVHAGSMPDIERFVKSELTATNTETKALEGSCLNASDTKERWRELAGNQNRVG